MTPATFRAWLERARETGAIRSNADAGRKLGVSPQSIAAFQRDGVQGPAHRRTALAMAAVLAGLPPWPEHD